MRRLISFVLPALLCATAVRSDDARDSASPADRAARKEALGAFNSLIGGWNGVGMPKRQSRRGAWTETAEWVWDFEDGGVAVRYDVKEGKLLKSARLMFDPKTESFHLAARFVGDVERDYTGKQDKTKFVFETKPDKAGEVHRITLTPLNPKRTLVLFEKRFEKQTFYRRIAEVGYTREGTRLASSDAPGPKCVVTGGVGTSQVTYKGKTYWVCCSGCREAFNDDPETILAEFKARQEKRKKDASDAKK